MNDLVELLRVPKGCTSTGVHVGVLNAAADEIERLRATVERQRDGLADYAETNTVHRQEIERLRQELASFTDAKSHSRTSVNATR